MIAAAFNDELLIRLARAPFESFTIRPNGHDPNYLAQMENEFERTSKSNLEARLLVLRVGKVKGVSIVDGHIDKWSFSKNRGPSGSRFLLPKVIGFDRSGRVLLWKTYFGAIQVGYPKS
jgi:hypothetical protein